MKTTFKFFFLSLIFQWASAQENAAMLDSINGKEIDSTISKLNNYRWRFEFSVGESKGITPYSENYFSTNNKKKFGVLDINSYTIGATYTLNRTIGIRGTFAFDRFREKENKSKPFETAQFRLGIEAMIDLNSFLKFNSEDSRFKFMLHSGIVLSTFQEVTSDKNPISGRRELNGGVVLGLMPMYRITNQGFIHLDLVTIHNFRQHYTWDGVYSNPDQNLYGHMINVSLGFSYSFGKQLKWKSDNKEIVDLEAKNNALQKRVEDLEIKMNDADKDGVPDYLDIENNSVAGVAVDTRGVMIDVNKNGVPDELERYLETKYGSVEQSKTIAKNNDSESAEFFKRSIDQGYISILFDIDSATPNAVSYDGIYFVLNYLKQNPSANITIVGYADAKGDKEYNKRLALARANNVKDILEKSGVESNRINAISGGMDQTVDVNASEARKLVRRVIFKIN
jgi:OmpA-OmpF porin, OOP family